MTLVWLSLVICSVVFLYIGVPWVQGRVARLALKRRAVKSNAIALTFDDGPGNRLTPAILNMLAEYDAKATFFLLGRNIAGREAIVRQIAEQGHEIGSHGYDHLHYWKVSPLRAWLDMKRGWKAIDVALELDKQKYSFRPPYGKMNIFCLLHLLFLQVPIVYWSVDSGDTWAAKPESDTLALFAKKVGGVVSLAHDFDRANNKTDRYVLESTRAIIAMAREQGMRLLTVSELLDADK